MATQSIIFSLTSDKLLSDIMFIHTIRHEEQSLTKGEIHIQKFADGESCVDYKTSVRGKRIFLLSSPNDADKIMQLILAIDAAKRAGAKEIIPILPYFPYARQDKRDQERGSIGAKVFASMLEQNGATCVVVFDLHADQIQGFFNIPVIHMDGKYLFGPIIADMDTSNMVLVSPDAGGVKRVKHFRDLLGWKYDIDLPYVTIDKTRSKANEVDKMIIIGDVTDKDVIIIDDMCDTAGTLCLAAKMLIEEGKARSVRSIVTHGVLSGPAYDRIANSVLEEFICSNTLPVNRPTGKIRIVNIDRQVWKAIYAINTNQSIESIKKE